MPLTVKWKRGVASSIYSIHDFASQNYCVFCLGQALLNGCVASLLIT